MGPHNEELRLPRQGRPPLAWRRLWRSPTWWPVGHGTMKTAPSPCRGVVARSDSWEEPDTACRFCRAKAV